MSGSIRQSWMILGLKAALTEQCWAFQNGQASQYELESAGESTRAARGCVFVLLSCSSGGSLHNIAKHAGATSVHMTCSSK